ncbi:MAG: hypothetical protein ACTJLL_02475 [Anaplasma sp.]
MFLCEVRGSLSSYLAAGGVRLLLVPCGMVFVNIGSPYVGWLARSLSSGFVGCISVAFLRCV